MLVLTTQLIPVSTPILLSQPLLCLPMCSVGARHASSLWCNNECIHYSLYCSHFNCFFSSRVRLSLASGPIPSPNLICSYVCAAQSSLYLNHLDQIALHLLSIFWNQLTLLEGFSPSLLSGILSLIFLTDHFFFCL